MELSEQTLKDIDRAFKSLEAWDEVLSELNEYGSIWVSYQIKNKSEKEIERIVSDVVNQAKKQAINIIKKHLGEVLDENEV